MINDRFATQDMVKPTNKQTALHLARNGWAVFPADPATKKPMPGLKWRNRATSDESQVKAWWSKWPEAVPAMPTGSANGVSVVDLDRHGEQDGVAAYRERGFDLNDASMIVETAGGGLHLYFEHREGIRNSADKTGVDVRGEGGYVIAPGAVSRAGEYRVQKGDPEFARLLGFEPFPADLIRPEPEPDTDQSDPGQHDLETLRDALGHVPNDGSYGDWCETLMALHHATGGSKDGLALAVGWSAGYPGFTFREVKDKWKSFGRKDGPLITADTLFAKAKKNGWGANLEWDDDESEPSIADLLDDDTGPSIEDLLDDAEPESDFLESAAGLEGVEIPPREWLVPDLIPHRTVTILGGDGGTGKSLLALQLAMATATESDWIGYTVDRPGPVVYISAEDDRDELHRRMASVTEAEGLTFSDLDHLLFKSLAGEGAILADLDRRSGKLRPTKLFKTLAASIATASPSLVVLDTLADLHSGDQNDQSHARQFITLLRGLCTRHGCTVLLLHHPSLTGITTGTGTGGSMAWNNSVRSRLYLRRVKEDGQELDPDARVLQTMKANYGRIGGEIALRWRDGVFCPVSDDDESEVQVRAELLFLRLLDEATESGQRVSPHTGANYAPAIFEAEAKTAGLSKAHMIHAMKAMIHDERLAVETVGPPSRRQKSLVRSHGGFTNE